MAFWNVIFRPRRALKTKQILREYGSFAHMRARLYRKTQYDRENHKKKLQNLVKNKNRKACTKIKARSINLKALSRTLAHFGALTRRNAQVPGEDYRRGRADQNIVPLLMEPGSHVKSFSLLDLTRRSRWGGGSLRAFRRARGT